MRDSRHVSPHHGIRQTLPGGAAVLALAVALTGCVGGGGTGSPDQPVTITFWHGFNLEQDVEQINSIIKNFEASHPSIKVEAVSDVDDAKIMQGIRGANSPDVISSFTTDSVGALCQGALIDLNPLMKESSVDPETFIPARLEYTQYQGTQCTLPLLGDAFGLYYNTEMFAAAGIDSPPKTWSEFIDVAVKLTKSNGDGYEQLGFMPSFHGYESDAATMLMQWGPKWSDQNGASALATDPQVIKFFDDVAQMQKALGGIARLEQYRLGFGDEWSAENAFEVGKVAMQIDGEWRAPLIASDGSSVKFATAPLPVPDDRAELYGMGPLTGTVVGIPSKSAHQAAAWEFVKYLTTDTDSLVAFANQIWNIPSTVESLHAPDLNADANFHTFVEISGNEHSAAFPSSANGNNYVTLFDDFAVKWQSGDVPDLKAGLAEVDKQIDAANKQVG